MTADKIIVHLHHWKALYHVRKEVKRLEYLTSSKLNKCRISKTYK